MEPVDDEHAHVHGAREQACARLNRWRGGWRAGGGVDRKGPEGDSGQVDRTCVWLLRWKPMEFGAWFVESTVSEPVSGWRERQGRGRPPLR